MLQNGTNLIEFNVKWNETEWSNRKSNSDRRDVNNTDKNDVEYESLIQLFLRCPLTFKASSPRVTLRPSYRKQKAKLECSINRPHPILGMLRGISVVSRAHVLRLHAVSFRPGHRVTDCLYNSFSHRRQNSFSALVLSSHGISRIKMDLVQQRANTVLRTFVWNRWTTGDMFIWKTITDAR